MDQHHPVPSSSDEEGLQPSTSPDSSDHVALLGTAQQLPLSLEAREIQSTIDLCATPTAAHSRAIGNRGSPGVDTPSPVSEKVFSLYSPPPGDETWYVSPQLVLEDDFGSSSNSTSMNSHLKSNSWHRDTRPDYSIPMPSAQLAPARLSTMSSIVSPIVSLATRVSGMIATGSPRLFRKTGVHAAAMDDSSERSSMMPINRISSRSTTFSDDSEDDFKFNLLGRSRWGRREGAKLRRKTHYHEATTTRDKPVLSELDLGFETTTPLKDGMSIATTATPATHPMLMGDIMGEEVLVDIVRTKQLLYLSQLKLNMRISILIAAIEMAVTMSLGVQYSASVLINLGVQLLICVGSSMVVLWRLSGKYSLPSDAVSKSLKERLDRRERRAVLIQAVFKITSGLSLIGFSLAGLLKAGAPVNQSLETLRYSVIVAFATTVTSFVVKIIMSVWAHIVRRKLTGDRASLRFDSMFCWVSSIMSLNVAVSSFVILEKDKTAPNYNAITKVMKAASGFSLVLSLPTLLGAFYFIYMYFHMRKVAKEEAVQSKKNKYAPRQASSRALSFDVLEYQQRGEQNRMEHTTDLMPIVDI